MTLGASPTHEHSKCTKEHIVGFKNAGRKHGDQNMKFLQYDWRTERQKLSLHFGDKGTIKSDMIISLSYSLY